MSLQFRGRKVNILSYSRLLFVNIQKYYCSKIIITWKELSMQFSLWKKTRVLAKLEGNQNDQCRNHYTHIDKAFKCNFDL